MHSLTVDLRFAVRMLLKSPGFSMLAIVTLSLAIGVNCAIFALVNGAFLKPVVPHEPDRVVDVFTARMAAERDYRPFSFAEFELLRGATDVFADVTAISFSQAGIGNGDTMRRGFIFLVSDNYFSLAGVYPAAGRWFTVEEARPNAAIPVVVASHRLWQRMGGSGNFVGSTIHINNRPYTVVGIAPKGFSGVSAVLAPEVWLPLGVHRQLGSAFDDDIATRDLLDPKSFTLNLRARLADGQTFDSVRGRLPAIAAQLNAIRPPGTEGERELQIHEPARFGISTSPSDESLVGFIGILMMAMAGAVLLIACLNLANMLLARGTARSREIAVRLAVGASRGAIVRQLLVEGLLLSLLGGAGGLILSVWANDFVFTSLSSIMASFNINIVIDLQPNAGVLLATLAFSAVATLMFSLFPAIKSSRSDILHDLKMQGHETAGTGWNRFFSPSHCLVMAQISLSLALLFAAGLFVRAAVKAGDADLGFETSGTTITEVDYTLINTDRADSKRILENALDRVSALPGVRSAAFGTLMPLGNIWIMRRIAPIGTPTSGTASDPDAPRAGENGVFTAITPGFFETLGIPIIRGRDFTDVETRDSTSPRVVIVDERMAKDLFPDGDAIGRRVSYTQAPTDGSPDEMEIVGIVRSFRHEVAEDVPERRLFVPQAHSFNGASILFTRFANEHPEAVAEGLKAVRAALREVAPDAPVVRHETFSAAIERDITLWIVRLAASAFGAFGLIAFVLASVGVYGVKAYAVGRRTREIGIRMALGARPGEIFSLVIRQGVAQTAFALAVGVVLALGVGQLFGSMLFQVSPRDPVALALSAAVLAAAAIIACWIPARRASRVDPLVAIRAE